MMEALRFPWGSDDERREVAPSAFKPRISMNKSRRVGCYLVNKVCYSLIQHI